jgi:hypothetical protein
MGGGSICRGAEPGVVSLVAKRNKLSARADEVIE